MRAIVCPRYGPPEVLQLVEIEKPVPKEQEVLVHVHAATVMAGDCELRGLKGSPMWQILLRLGFGIRSPRRKVLGQDLAGKVEAVGAGVTKFKAGDQVFGNTGLRLGAYADYCCLGQDGPIATKPANMTYDEAATIPSAVIYTFPLLEKVNIKEGQSVLVIGAGGTMGSMVVQFAKASGADVTGVDSTSKVEMVRSIGADKTVDYTKDDYTSKDERYDVIFDVTGKASFSGCLRILKEGGVYVMGNLGVVRVLRGRWATLRGTKKVIAGYTQYRVQDIEHVKELIEAGKIRSVIDRRYPLEQVVEAHRYVETGEKMGNVVLTMS